MPAMGIYPSCRDPHRPQASPGQSCRAFHPDPSCAASSASSLASSSPYRHGFGRGRCERVTRHLGRRRSGRRFRRVVSIMLLCVGLGLRPLSRSQEAANPQTGPSGNCAFSCIILLVDGEDKTPRSPLLERSRLAGRGRKARTALASGGIGHQILPQPRGLRFWRGAST